MSCFDNDHLTISNIIIDFEENLLLISDFNKSSFSINNLEEFNNLRAELNDQLMNIENETTILINTLKIIQYSIRKFYDDYAKIKCCYEENEIKLKSKINENKTLLNKYEEIEKQINYKNQIIEEQNKHILELVKLNKNNDKIIKDLKYQVKHKNTHSLFIENEKTNSSNENKTISNEKIIHYKNFLKMKNKFNNNFKNDFESLTEERNKINIKSKFINNYKDNLLEKPNLQTKISSTIENEKYIFRDDLEENENIDNNFIKNEKIRDNNNNNNLTSNNKREINNKIKLIEKEKYNSSVQMIKENTKDKILNKISEDKIIKKLKRKGKSAKNIHKIKNKNFEFDEVNNKLTKYFLFNLQREKILNNKNFLKFIKEKTPKYKM